MKALRVLIIENETVIALLFAEVLTEMGHVVCGSEMTEDGAVAAAARLQPDLIIADVRLLEGSGLDAINAILKTGFVPHVFVSGDVLDRRLLHPAAGVLQKPFYEGQLIKALEHAIKNDNILADNRPKVGMGQTKAAP